MDVRSIHQGGDPAFPAPAAQYQALDLGELPALPPHLGTKGYQGVGLLNFPLRGPPGCAVLAVSHGLALDAVQAAPAGCHGHGGQDAEDQRKRSYQHPDSFRHGENTSSLLF